MWSTCRAGSGNFSNVRRTPRKTQKALHAGGEKGGGACLRKVVRRVAVQGTPGGVHSNCSTASMVGRSLHTTKRPNTCGDAVGKHTAVQIFGRYRLCHWITISTQQFGLLNGGRSLHTTKRPNTCSDAVGKQTAVQTSSRYRLCHWITISTQQFGLLHGGPILAHHKAPKHLQPRHSLTVNTRPPHLLDAW
jgi:hypothetical protein